MTLPSHAQIVVIGGGIIGCSTAYHLARDHRADVLLIEQGKLTSGSTWHAAGLVGQLRSSASITRVLKYSVELYKGLAAETGLETGWKMTGCLRLATNADRWTEYKRLATTARSFGMEMHLVSPEEVKRMWPLMETSDLVGASWLPTDGQASPSDITQSLARGARMHGARIVEGVRVTGFAIESWSYSWNASVSNAANPAAPPSATTGTPSRWSSRLKLGNAVTVAGAPGASRSGFVRPI